MTLRTALLASLLLVLASLAPGQSLAQLRLEGSLSTAARVEIEVGALVKGEPRILELRAFLAEGTTGADVIRLLAGRMQSAEIHSHVGSAAVKDPGAGTLFIEQALHVNLRLDQGIRGSVTACEGAPLSLKVIAPDKDGLDLSLLLSANAIHPVTRASKTVSLEVPMAAGNHSAQNCEALMEAAVTAKWGCDRPKADLWRPLRLSDGSRLEGVSVQTKNGWRVEVTLAQVARSDE
ncbi:MAG: hypothetical protein O2816_04700 [Planctomycetota bacterium]|nr:hypothetical protein [Planctomycetota bacterium]